ncbi:hypothetical protein A3F27_00415 [Candidatus Kaiserbacteria bacterium RIFCSPHIGHO2_12_FULL_53_13]|uniref:SMC-Scp complex subunit ScpB n=1 Tax=Candidatus Kaiserbacteria bacterium RIFCSPHIGHO2_12_FULL_53_13 TaxID=1798502 RepID=A0A1F6E7P7_9BACT|nr:MAG: hypothetical protein A3F27_00415 [Candidatus Kaiserbacteria bacterium RIFCSPHIGHO2_12_FULL_53_13]OGG74424.1 MAG: hypothetical protein A3A37_02120 [Candidatus Kaiserbacteria bacterium RIFCSPLOWO2_01_FULL_52_36]
MNSQQQISDVATKAGAFLFAEGGVLSLRKLAQLIGCSQAELVAGLQQLRDRLSQSGVSLIRTDTEAGLSVSPEAADSVEAAYERELGREIGDAGLEVLAILLYRGPSTRAEIDYIRGVNTSSTLRTLLARGLAVRENNPKDAREYLYRCTVELLAHLGVTDVSKLPEYAKITSELASFETAQKSLKTEHGDLDDTRNSPAQREGTAAEN